MRKTEMMTKFKSNQKGITLIALVITIIVLLIIAGIAISMLSGENGILKQASNAKENMEVAQTEESLKLAILGSFGQNGKIDLNILNTELNKIGIEEISKLPAIIELDKQEFLIEKNGTIVNGNIAPINVRDIYEFNNGYYIYKDGTIKTNSSSVYIRVPVKEGEAWFVWYENPEDLISGRRCFKI